MWSRRQFVISLLTSSAFCFDYESNSALAFSKRNGSAKVDPHLIAAEYWPAAISCNFLDVFGDDFCCMTDDLGRLATAAILPAAQHSHSYPVLGEVNNLGLKVFFLKAIQPQLVLVIVQRQGGQNATTKGKRRKQTENADVQDIQFVCYLVNLSAIQAPHIVSTTIISNYSQLNAFAFNTIKNQPVLSISGLDLHGDNRLSFYTLRGKNKLQTLSSIKLKEAAKHLVLGTETLLVLHETQRVSTFSVNEIANPQFIRTLELSDQVSSIAGYDDVCVWSAQQGDKCVLTVSSLRTFPKAVSKVNADGLFSVESLAMNGKHVLALGSDEANVSVVPFSVDKNYLLKQQEPVKLIGFAENSTVSSKIVLGKDAAFISSGWAGMQVLAINQKGIWSATTCYCLQRLPIAELAFWSNYLLLAGAELQLFDLSHSKRPKLLNSTKLQSTVKKMASAGSYVLSLDKSAVTLRKIENPENILAKLEIVGDYLSFDKVNHKGYLIQSAETQDTKKKATQSNLVQLNVYNNSVQVAKTFSILEGSYLSSADEGYILVGNIDSLVIYKADQESEFVCKREFKDLAWREIILSKGNIFATAIDHNANGFFLTMSFDGQAINLLSSTELPHDASSLCLKDDFAFTVGQNAEGNGLLTTIDISNNNKPKIGNSKPVLQSAAAVATNNNLVTVCGQGFQIFSI